GLRDRQEAPGLERAGADEGSVDLLFREELRRVLRRDRAAIEDARRGRGGLPEAVPEEAAQDAVGFGRLRRGRGAARADRPDRLVREREAGRRRAELLEGRTLPRQDLRRLPVLALVE